MIIRGQLLAALSAAACRGLLAKPKFRLCWSLQQPTDVHTPRAFDSMQPAISPHYRSVQRQWLHWQLQLLLGAVQPLHKLLHLPGLGTLQDVAAVAAPAAAADAGTAAGTAVGSSGSQRLPSRLQWDYVMQQVQNSSIWTTAIVVFDSKWSSGLVLLAAGQLGDANTAEEAVGSCMQMHCSCAGHWQQQRRCRSSCNNPHRSNLAEATEKALAAKQCAGCRCRHCSAVCQRADWKRHRPACKAMVAAGLCVTDGGVHM
jgi:hypothetical protein